MKMKKCNKCKNTEFEIFERSNTYNVKGNTNIEIQERVMQCSTCGEIIFNEELEKENLEILFNKYRIEKKLLGPHEIKAIREKYDLGQRAFAKILGWGEITIHRYENNNLIDETHSKMLELIKEPQNMRTLLEESKDKIGETTYKKVNNRLNLLEKEAIEEGKPIILSMSKRIDEYSGYIKFNFEKFKNLVLFMIENAEADYKTKLWKVLFYSDILYFKDNLVSITGVPYIKNYYGPTPEKHDYLLGYLTDISNSIEIKEDINGRELLSLNSKIDLSIFSEDELEIMNIVAAKFASFSASEIAEYSHKEKAWLEPNFKEYISLDKYADSISIIN